MLTLAFVEKFAKTHGFWIEKTAGNKYEYGNRNDTRWSGEATTLLEAAQEIDAEIRNLEMKGKVVGTGD
jgi:hypothetical protein